MAAPVVASSAQNSGSSGFSVTKPAGTAAGDLLIAAQASDFDTLATNGLPTGFTPLTTSQFDGGSNKQHIAIGYKIATGSEPASYAFPNTGSGSDDAAGILRVTGADGTPVIAQVAPATVPTGTTGSAPSITPNGADDLLLCFISSDRSNSGGALSWTPPAGMTEHVDVQSNGAWTTLSIASLQNPSSPSGTKTFTSSVNRTVTGGACTISIKSAAPASVTGALAGTLPAVTGSLTGVIPQDVTGALAGTLPAVTGSLTGTSDAPPQPFVTAVSGLHFVDQDGQPILVKGDTVWAAPVNFGRWNGGNWQGDCDTYMSTRAGQGYNALYMAALGSVQNNGPADTGATFDGVLPFVGGDPGVLNDTYWQRVDYILSSAEAHGITVFLDLAYSSDLDNAALAGKTAAQFTGYGTAIGTRYKNRPNLVYTFGGDYFDTYLTQLTNAFNAIRATGDTHVFSVQNYPESTSRRDLSNNSLQDTGAAVADYNFVYTYNWTYFGVEFAHGEASPLPVLWNDGHYDQGTTADRRLMRNLTWWALSSGSRGNIIGTESAWGWPSGGLASVTSPDAFTGTDLPAIRGYFESLTGWHLLLPDTDNSLVTAGRGTRAGSLPSGGGSEVTNATALSDYVGASVTPDGTLAVVYVPTGATITVDDAELVAGCTVKRVDPVTCAETTLTPSATYGGFGNNSQGQADWLLVFQAPTGVTGTVGGTLPALTGAVAGAVSVTGSAAGTLPAAAGSMSGSLSVAAAVDGTLPAVTGAITGSLGVHGVIDGLLEQVTGAVSADATVTGGLGGTVPGVTGAMAGVVGTDVVGALAGTLPPLVGALAGAAGVDGAAAGTLPGVAGGLTGFVGVELPPVDFTATIAPARVRGRATVAASHGAWAAGDTRAGMDVDDNRVRQRATVAASHEIPSYAATASRQDWQAGDTRTGLDVGPSRDDRKE